MKPKVIIYSKLEDIVLNKIQETCDVVILDSKQSDFAAELTEHLPSSIGLIGSGLKVDDALLEQAPLLKIVCNISVGYDNLDIQALTERGIIATNTPDVLTETTADLVFGLMLTAARRIAELDRYVKDRKWTESIQPPHFGVDVYGKTLGMIGMGRIGEAIARRARFGFNMSILYHNRSRKQSAEQQLQASYCSFDELLQNSDFVCLMTPYNKETEKLIGEREFALMKRSAIFINGSRGNTVDEQALIQALENKTIASAGLDVYEKEPMDPNHPLLRMEHVVTLPHIGSATHQTRLDMALLAAENLLAGVMGDRPPNMINPSVWKSV